ncbi:hypothetical protein D3C87_2207530 [compost metagenome]
MVQEAEGISAGRDMLHFEPVKPEPLIKPKRETASSLAADDDILPSGPASKAKPANDVLAGAD